MKFFKKKSNLFKTAALVMAMSLVLVGCGSKDSGKTSEKESKIEIDGSSTVYPITEAIAEEFQIANPDVKITVGTSGTGGGFKRFTKGETDVSNASREIKEEEAKTAKDNNIEYTKIDVAYDGIAVVTNKENKFAKDLTTDELKKIWEPNSKVKLWSDVRSEWPKETIKLYGPGTDSGTFDYFTETIMGESGKIRTDFTASEDDNVLIKGISGDKYSLGYFGYAYYVENKDKLNVLKINGIEPTDKTIQSGEYAPLSRTIFIYLSNNSVIKNENVRNFANMYMDIAKEVVKDVGYVPLEEKKYEEGKKAIENIK